MEPTTKNKIIKLKLKGLIAPEIAEELNENYEAVKSFLKRIKDKDLKTLKYCENCGKEMQIKLNCRPARFCCSKCKDAWWRKNRDKLNHHICVEHTCLHCGKKFIVYGNRKRTYCSSDCYLAEVRKDG